MPVKSRNIALFATLAIGAISLSGCASTSPTSQKKAITVLWQSNGDNAAIPAIAKAFEAANPDITVNVKFLADPDIASLLGTQLPAGNGPDAFMVQLGAGTATSLVSLAQKGLIAKIDDLSWASKLDSGTRGVGSFNGHLYGLSPTAGAEGAIYNLDAVQKAGLTIPTTWDELLKFCGDAKRAGTTAFSLGLKEGWTTRLVPDALLATTVTDPDKVNAEIAAGTFDYSKDPGFLSAFKKEDQLNKAGCFNKSPVGSSIDNDSLPAAAKGQVLATVTGAFHLGSLLVANPNVKVEIYPLPASNTANDNKMQLSYSNALVVNAKSKNLEAAKKFADFFGQADSLNAIATQYQLNPTIPNDTYKSPASLATIAKLAKEKRVVNLVWLAGPKQQAAATTAIQSLFLGSVTPEQLTKQIQDGYNRDNGK